MIPDSEYSCNFINKWMGNDLPGDYCKDDLQFLQEFIESDKNLFNYNVLDIGNQEWSGGRLIKWSNVGDQGKNIVFKGVIPDSIGNLKFLNSLNLQYNELYGQVPRSLCQIFPNINNLNLSNNNFCPPWPSCIIESIDDGDGHHRIKIDNQNCQSSSVINEADSGEDVVIGLEYDPYVPSLPLPRNFTDNMVITGAIIFEDECDEASRDILRDQYSGEIISDYACVAQPSFYNSNILWDGSIISDGMIGSGEIRHYDLDGNLLFDENIFHFLNDNLIHPQWGASSANANYGGESGDRPSYAVSHDHYLLPAGDPIISGGNINETHMLVKGDMWFTKDAAITNGINPDTYWYGNEGDIPDNMGMRLPFLVHVSLDHTRGTFNLHWSWFMVDHLIQDYTNEHLNWGVIKDNPNKLDINVPSSTAAYYDDLVHGNNIAWNPDTSQIVLSLRNYGDGEFIIIDYPSGDIVWRCCNPANYDMGIYGSSGEQGEIGDKWSGSVDSQLTRAQHSVNWIPPGYPGGGNLIFLNNEHRYGGTHLFPQFGGSNGNGNPCYGYHGVTAVVEITPTEMQYDSTAPWGYTAQVLEMGRECCCEEDVGIEMCSYTQCMSALPVPLDLENDTYDPNSTFWWTRIAGGVHRVASGNIMVSAGYNNLLCEIQDPYEGSPSIVWNMSETGAPSLETRFYQYHVGCTYQNNDNYDESHGYTSNVIHDDSLCTGCPLGEAIDECGWCESDILYNLAYLTCGTVGDSDPNWTTVCPENQACCGFSPAGFGGIPSGYDNSQTPWCYGFEWPADSGINYDGVCVEPNASGYCETDCILGNLNGDGGWNVLDIVALVNYALSGECYGYLTNPFPATPENCCTADMNGDGGPNVLDIVILINCILAGNCCMFEIQGTDAYEDMCRLGIQTPPEGMTLGQQQKILKKILSVGEDLQEIKRILDKEVPPHIISGGRTTTSRDNDIIWITENFNPGTTNNTDHIISASSEKIVVGAENDLWMYDLSIQPASADSWTKIYDQGEEHLGKPWMWKVAGDWVVWISKNDSGADFENMGKVFAKNIEQNTVFEIFDFSDLCDLNFDSCAVMLGYEQIAVSELGYVILSVKKNCEHSPTPNSDCQWPNCAEAILFDLNNQSSEVLWEGECEIEYWHGPHVFIGGNNVAWSEGNNVWIYNITSSEIHDMIEFTGAEAYHFRIKDIDFESNRILFTNGLPYAWSNPFITYKVWDINSADVIWELPGIDFTIYGGCFECQQYNNDYNDWGDSPRECENTGKAFGCYWKPRPSDWDDDVSSETYNPDAWYGCYCASPGAGCCEGGPYYESDNRGEGGGITTDTDEISSETRDWIMWMWAYGHNTCAFAGALNNNIVYIYPGDENQCDIIDNPYSFIYDMETGNSEKINGPGTDIEIHPEFGWSYEDNLWCMRERTSLGDIYCISDDHLSDEQYCQKIPQDCKSGFRWGSDGEGGCACIPYGPQHIKGSGRITPTGHERSGFNSNSRCGDIVAGGQSYKGKMRECSNNNDCKLFNEYVGGSWECVLGNNGTCCTPDRSVVSNSYYENEMDPLYTDYINYTDQELIHKMFEYENDYQIPYYEEERTGGFQLMNSGNCTECIDYIPSLWDTPDNGDGTWGGPKVLITAPHATSQYRFNLNGSNSYFRHDCDITPEQCADNVLAENMGFDEGHNQGCCGKEPDNYTGALARIIAEMTGMPAIIATRKDMDANKYHSGNYGNGSDRLYFKQKIQDVIWDYPSIELVIDLHGADNYRPFQIDIGTGNGESLEDWANGGGWVPWWPPGDPNSADPSNHHDIDTSFYMDRLREAAGLYEIPNHDGEGGIPQDHTFTGWGSTTDSVIKFIAGGSSCGGGSPDCPDYWWFERPAMQLEINERYRTDVENYPDPYPDWRFNPVLFGTGPADINSNLIKMARTLSAFVWNIQTGEFPSVDQPVLNCSCNCIGDNCSVCDIVQNNYEDGTWTEEAAAVGCYSGNGMYNCDWYCGEDGHLSNEQYCQKIWQPCKKGLRWGWYRGECQCYQPGIPTMSLYR